MPDVSPFLRFRFSFSRLSVFLSLSFSFLVARALLWFVAEMPSENLSFSCWWNFVCNLCSDCPNPWFDICVFFSAVLFFRFPFHLFFTCLSLIWCFRNYFNIACCCCFGFYHWQTVPFNTLHPCVEWLKLFDEQHRAHSDKCNCNLQFVIEIDFADALNSTYWKFSTFSIQPDEQNEVKERERNRDRDRR